MKKFIWERLLPQFLTLNFILMNYRKKAIWVVGALLCLNFGAYAQSISLKMNQVSVKRAMTGLQEKSGYSFVYIAGDIDTDKTVSVDADQLEEAISQILTGQDVSYEIQGKNIIIRKTGNYRKSKQEKQISGTVKDNNGEPVIGASVREAGTSNGTITDLEGNFVLNVSAEDSELEISYIGYETLLIKSDASQIRHIILQEDSQNLEEVVVIGYGTTKKSDLIASVSSV